jgi:hypothetical protein
MRPGKVAISKRRVDCAPPLVADVRPHRSDNVKRTIAAILTLGCIYISNSANASCPDGQLQFAFSNLKVSEAFAIFADFAGLRAEIDRSLTQSEPMNFGCTPWQVAAKNLADRHNLSLRIENGSVYVSKK